MDASSTAAKSLDTAAFRNGLNWSAAYRDHEFQRLLRLKANRIRPAVLLYFSTYIALSAFAGFVPQIMDAKLIGALSLGYCLILLTYVVAWAVALWYVRVAERDFDPLKESVLESIQTGRSSR
jgi:uncharacterized membrane protein (DUF485 family)